MTTETGDFSKCKVEPIILRELWTKIDRISASGFLEGRWDWGIYEQRTSKTKEFIRKANARTGKKHFQGIAEEAVEGHWL